MKRDLKRKGSSLKTAASGKRAKPEIPAMVSLPVSQHRANFIRLKKDLCCNGCGHLFRDSRGGHNSGYISFTTGWYEHPTGPPLSCDQ